MATAGNKRFKALRSVPEVFEALGGAEGIAQITSMNYRTVLNWRQLYDRLPAKTYLLLQGRLKRRGYIGDPGLWGML